MRSLPRVSGLWILLGIAAGACVVRAGGAPAPLVVEARLSEATAVPEPADIAPYVSALVVHTYRILNVLSGELSDRDISVAHWAIRDGKVLRVPAETNATVRLKLVPFHLRHDLRAAKVEDTTSRFDLLFFFAEEFHVEDVGPED